MSDALRWPRMTRGAGIALALFLGMAAQAEARGIVADMATFGPDPTLCTFATLPSECMPVQGTSDYVYAEGVVSFGSALNSVPTGTFSASALNLSTFGNYIAVGLSDYSTEPTVTIGTGNSGLEIRWSIPGGVFGLNFQTDFSDNTPQAVAMYADNSTVPNFTLPNDTVFESNYSGCQSDAPMFHNCATVAPFSPNYDAGTEYTTPNNFSYNNIVLNITDATTDVPEPATWPLMLIGLGAMGVVMARRKQPSPHPNPPHGR